jgi:hypothetical protein
MRTFIALGLCVIATAAVAQPRPSTPSLPCARAASLVQTQGAIVLGTGDYTYDRFVSGGNFCLVGERTDPAWVPSADNLQCFVGYRCRQRARPN